MKHGLGVTSAVDIIAPKPAARPEPAAKASSRDDDRSSFANALDAETSRPEAASARQPSEEPAAAETPSQDEPATPDTNIAAQTQQPQPQPTPAINSPEAILAGLTQAAPADAALAEAGAIAPAIDTAAAVAGQGAAKAAATPQPAAPQGDVETTEQAGEAVMQATGTKPAAPARAAQGPDKAPATAVAADAAPLSAPPLSAPGNERASAPGEPATTSNEKSATTANAAADPSANKAQGAQANGAQGNGPHGSAAQASAGANVSSAAEVAPALKTDAPLTPVSTLVDAARTGSAEATRAAPANAALHNAPATTVQVYQRMVERFDGRAQRYEIRLDPAELGRVDVRIEVGADKKVHAVLAAHDSAALTDLMRGQRSLERALSDAGVDVADGGIRFELSSDQGRNPAGNSNGNDGDGRSGNVWRGFNTVDVGVDAQTAARPWRSQARLDVVA